jgi:arsenate reductase
MSATYTIYHNPRCSKSRLTMPLLEEHNITPTVVEYLSNPPDAETLSHLLGLLGLEPRGLMRTKEEDYRRADLADPARSDAELIAGMIAHPKIIERPIVVKHGADGDQAVLGRPPENVLALL